MTVRAVRHPRVRWLRVRCLGATAVILLAGCGDGEPAAQAPPATESVGTRPTVTAAAVADPSLWPTEMGAELQEWTVEVMTPIDHDPTAFTQGLEATPAGILESTGRQGQSTLRLWDPTTGVALETRRLDDEHFGEGLTVVGDEIVQLTWTSGLALRYEFATLAPLDPFVYTGEGWGLCFDGASLWMSDGSARLTRRDPETFAALGTIEVRREGEPVGALNELECTEGMVLANVWQSDEILVVDPTTGTVAAVIDASPIVERIDAADPADVLNGIADLGDGTLLLGGKHWPQHFVVSLVQRTASSGS